VGRGQGTVVRGWRGVMECWVAGLCDSAWGFNPMRANLVVLRVAENLASRAKGIEYEFEFEDEYD
jgi:hypothetical protein